MSDHSSPSKLSPIAPSFTPGDGPPQLQFTRQKEEVTTVLGDFKKFKGKQWPKSKSNKPQHRKYLEPEPQPQPVYYMDKEILGNMCEAKRKALSDGMVFVCVGCGAFAKKTINPSHNWSSIMETDYSNYLAAPPCPHSGTANGPTHGKAEQNFSRFENSGKKSFEQIGNPGKKPFQRIENSDQQYFENSSKSTSTQPDIENSKPAKPQDQSVQTEPTIGKSRPTSSMISSWHNTIPMELENVLANTPELYETKYKAHYHIKTALDMFDKFVDEYDAVLQENKVLQTKLGGVKGDDNGNGKKDENVLLTDVGEMKINGEIKGEIKKKESNEYLGYYVDENEVKSV